MRKITLYIIFALASGLVAATFVTTKNYLQLAIAIGLYLPLTYFAFKLFPRKNGSENGQTQKTIVQTNNPGTQTQQNIQPQSSPSYQNPTKDVEILDIEKRAFLKIIGATGLSIFISSLLSKRFGNFFGKSEGSGITQIQDPQGNLISPAKQSPTDNYKISEVDYGITTYYGFIDGGEGWFIMKEDLDSGTYRYIKGDSNFYDNWENRESLKYDYFNQVFPAS
jgi:hypothetical protein